MIITFLGTGTGVPRAERGSPGLLIQSGDSLFLVDSGSGTLRQLARAGYTHHDLDYILYTHFHPDHTADLVPYLFAMRYWPPAGRENPVLVLGPTGFIELVNHLKGAYEHWIEPEEGMIFDEFPIGRRHRRDCGGVGVESGPVPHTPHSLGYRFTGPGGGTVAVTGDTDYGEGLIELARGADLLVTECSHPEGRKTKGHLTSRLAGRAARESGAKALALTHFYPETDGYDLLAEVRQEYDGPVTLAEDLFRMDL